MEQEKLQQNCPAPQRRWLHGWPPWAWAGGTARAAAVSNRAKRSDGRFFFTAVLLSVPGCRPLFIITKACSGEAWSDAGGGIRTRKPFRVGDFKSPAYTVPPLRLDEIL